MKSPIFITFDCPLWLSTQWKTSRVPSGGRILLLITFSLFLLSHQVKAENTCESKKSLQENECVVSGQWHFALNVGLGVRTNPLNNSDNIPLILLPQISYYDDNFFIENLDVGYNLVDFDTHQLNLIATPSYDSVFFNRWDPSNIFVDIGASADNRVGATATAEDNLTEIDPQEVSKRKFSYLGGIEYSYAWTKSQLQFSLLTDISRVHSGKEVRFAYQYNVNHHFSATVGLTWKDKNLSDYYYGVDENEIIDDRGAYTTEASINPFVRMSLSTSDRKDAWRISLELQRLDKNISQSPLTKDDQIITFFVGKQFNFDT